jgi:outer membrane protein insertion porin family
MSRCTILALLLVILPVSLFAQQNEEWYIDKPIKDFTFTGLAAVAVGDLQAIVKPYIGKAFTIDLFWEIQGKLYALDSFESIEGEAKAADDSQTAVVVNFTVKERPAVSSIVFNGNRDVRSADILGKIVLKKGDLVSQSKVKSEEATIRALYLEKGYADVAVTGNISTPDADNMVAVTFDIVEGAQTTIKEVRFSGNSFASESTLRNLMKTKPPFLFDAGVFQESKLEEDKKAIVDYYTDHGFVDAKIDRVDREVQSQGGKNFLVITVYLTEGLQWTFAGMDFTGNSVFTTQQLQDMVFQKKGKVISVQKLQADILKIQNLYWESGYIFNLFNVQESRDEAARTIAYTLAVQENDKAHIENIIFKGNKVTKDYVLRRELPFEEGDIFNRSKVAEGLRNLYYLQYFSSVVPEFPNGSANGLVDVVINVEEQSTADINFGVMISGASFPVSGTIKWADKNFLGRGETFGVGLELSPIKQAASFSFLEPWMLGVRWAAGFDISFEHALLQNILQDILPPIFGDDQAAIAAPDPYTNLTDYLAAIQSGKTIPSQYKMSYDSLDLKLGFNTGYRWQTTLGYFGLRGGISSRFRYLTYDPTLYRPFDLTVRNNLNTWNIIDQLYVSTYLDGRDVPISPTTGYEAIQTFSYTGGFLFGSRHYNRSDTTLEGFLTLLNIPVSEIWSFMTVLAAHSSFSILLPQFAYFLTPGASASAWGWTNPITDPTDLLYIDGMMVGRGWGQAYGQVLWDNKLELRIPIAKEYIWGVSFFDAVGLWQTPSELSGFNIEQFYFSFGLGLRFTIPQFPIRIYIGKKFQVQNGQVVWTAGSIGDPNSFWNFDVIISLGGTEVF